MTEASSILLEAVSRYPSFEPETADAGEADAGNEANAARYAPATWLDALMVDERSRPDQPLASRITGPSDEAGLYPMFSRVVD